MCLCIDRSLTNPLFTHRSHIELAVAIFAACVAALRPLARVAVASVVSAKGGSKGSSKQYYPVDGNPPLPAVELRDREARDAPRFDAHPGSQERIVKQTDIDIDFAPAKTPSVAEGGNSDYRA